MANTDPPKKAASEGAIVTTTAAAAAAPEDEEWVLTFSGQTGDVIKIEKLDKSTGQRTELTEEEYAAVAGQDLSGASDFADESAYYASAYGDPYGLEEAYYQGVQDAYYQSMTESDPSQAAAGYEMTPEEAAYYQGVEDYVAANMG